MSKQLAERGIVVRAVRWGCAPFGVWTRSVFLFFSSALNPRAGRCHSLSDTFPCVLLTSRLWFRRMLRGSPLAKKGTRNFSILGRNVRETSKIPYTPFSRTMPSVPDQSIMATAAARLPSLAGPLISKAVFTIRNRLHLNKIRMNDCRASCVAPLPPAQCMSASMLSTNYSLVMTVLFAVLALVYLRDRAEIRRLRRAMDGEVRSPSGWLCAPKLAAYSHRLVRIALWEMRVMRAAYVAHGAAVAAAMAAFRTAYTASLASKTSPQLAAPQAHAKPEGSVPPTKTDESHCVMPTPTTTSVMTSVMRTSYPLAAVPPAVPRDLLSAISAISAAKPISGSTEQPLAPRAVPSLPALHDAILARRLSMRSSPTSTAASTPATSVAPTPEPICRRPENTAASPFMCHRLPSPQSVVGPEDIRGCDAPPPIAVKSFSRSLPKSLPKSGDTCKSGGAGGAAGWSLVLEDVCSARRELRKRSTQAIGGPLGAETRPRAAQGATSSLPFLADLQMVSAWMDPSMMKRASATAGHESNVEPDAEGEDADAEWEGAEGDWDLRT